MKVKMTYEYDIPGLTPLTWWTCSKLEPYAQWYPDIDAATDAVGCCTRKQKKAFRDYCERTPERWGMYYDLLSHRHLNFEPEQCATVFKLYGKKPRFGVPMNLVQELVTVLDTTTKARPGGPTWIERMKKKLKLPS